MKKIAIVTVSFNGLQDTLEFLDSGKNLITNGFEIIWVVVDNGSVDTLSKELLKNRPNVEVVQMGFNAGFTGGYNRGMRYSIARGADYILVINNDTLFADKDVLQKLVGTLESDSQIGVVTPKIWFAPGFEYFKDKYKNADRGKVLWYAGGDFDWNNLMSVHRGIDQVDTGKYDKVETVEFVSGCCFLVKREVLEEVGYFDEKLFAYFEDNDWITSVINEGWKLAYDGRVGIYHKVSRTAGIGSSMADYFITRNRLEFARKYAKLRTQMAIAREAIKTLVSGRTMQRRGILDFLLSRWGPIQNNKPERVTWPMELSIAIVNYKTKELTRKLLKSIYKESQQLEIVVLDNGSKDGCGEMMRKEFPQAVLIQSKKNLGFSCGYNTAMDACRGRYVLMLNSDIIVKKGAINKLLEFKKKLGGQAVLTGKLILPNGTVQKSVFHLPTIKGAIEEYFFGKRDTFFGYLPKGEKVSKVDGAMMACLLIPSVILNKIGRLSEKTNLYFEDVEYSRRLARGNIPIYYIPNAVFNHHHGASSKKLGSGEAQRKLQMAAKWYYGEIYYRVLFGVLWLGQKLHKHD